MIFDVFYNYLNPTHNFDPIQPRDPLQGASIVEDLEQVPPDEK